MKKSIQIFPNVKFLGKYEAEDFIIVGVPPKGKQPGDLETRIGGIATLRSHTVIYAGNIIGSNFQTGHGVLIRESNEIGDNVSIGSHSVVEHHVKIGNRVRIHSNVFIPEFSVIEPDVWIGPCVVLTNAKYPNTSKTKNHLIGPLIKKGAIIGANATILPGIKVGEDALIGAGAVVVRDVAAGEIVAGNPAININEISKIKYYDNENNNE